MVEDSSPLGIAALPGNLVVQLAALDELHFAEDEAMKLPEQRPPSEDDEDHLGCFFYLD
jgi:hypothetical protein